MKILTNSLNDLKRNKMEKETTLEEALLEDIKFLLLAKSDTLAIRLIEKYGHNKQQERSYSKQQLEKVWKAAEQNMRSQFSSSQYKNVTFEEYYERQSI